MGDMGEVFKAWREEQRQEREAAIDAAEDALPESSGEIAFVWVNDYHVHAKVRGKVIAQWWPSQGKTMIGQRRGKRCPSAGEFVKLAEEVARG